MAEPSSRRTFLKHASWGAAAVGVAAATPTVLAAPAAAATPKAAARAPEGPAYDGVVTAYVRDYRTGEIAVMAGEHEVIHHDRELAGRLAAIAARAGQH